MANSSDIYNQIQELMGQVNPMLDKLPDAEKYYKDKVNEAYQYNLPALQNAANLESKMYSMPGNLMGAYNTEFGGKTGVSSNQRINDILGSLGRQSGVVSTAWGLADQKGTRINDLANTLLNQYKTEIEAKQAKLSPLMSIWERMFAEEQANSRARGSGGGGYTSPWGNLTVEDDEENNNGNTGGGGSSVPTRPTTRPKTSFADMWINKYLPKSSGQGAGGGGGGAW